MHKFMKFGYKALYVISVFSLVASTALSAGVTPALASGSAAPSASGSAVPSATVPANCTFTGQTSLLWWVTNWYSCTWHRFKIFGGECKEWTVVRSVTTAFGTETYNDLDENPGFVLGDWLDWQPGGCPDEVLGCTDPGAINYNPEATENDGSCEYDVLGCTDPEAVNYNSEATVDNGSCEYLGCTDPNADNYDETATTDDGSCEYLGCTDPNADNYDETANVDDGSCYVMGCMDPNAPNYNPNATIDDESCGQYCQDQDALNPLEPGFCEYYSCTDPDAVSFNDPSSTTTTKGEESCNYWVCDDEEAVNYHIEVSTHKEDLNSFCQYEDVEVSMDESITDPAAEVCEEVYFVIENTGDVSLALVSYEVYNGNGILVGSGSFANLDPDNQVQVAVYHAEPTHAYTLYAWIGAPGSQGDADSTETSGEVEACEEPSNEQTVVQSGTGGGGAVSGVLIPVTGFDAAGQAAFLASMAANLGLGSLGAGLLMHGLSLRKKNKKDE